MAGITNLVCLQILVLTLAGSTMQGDAKTGKLGENAANFMEDEQWLSTISQYSRKIKHWNRFRDEVEDDYIRTVEDPQGSEESVDTTKDPCQKVKCSRHKVCVAQGYQRAMCINPKKLEQRMQHPGLMPHVNSCKACSLSASTPVCGSDGHSYASQCKLEQQACLNGKELSVRCSGPCPCVSEAVIKPKAGTEPTPKTDHLLSSMMVLVGHL